MICVERGSNIIDWILYFRFPPLLSINWSIDRFVHSSQRGDGVACGIGERARVADSFVPIKSMCPLFFLAPLILFSLILIYCYLFWIPPAQIANALKALRVDVLALQVTRQSNIT